MHRLSRLFVVRIMHINRFSQYAAHVYIFLRILVHYYSFKIYNYVFIKKIK